MRTKAREGFSKALRDAHRWLDELLFDPTQTIESLAVGGSMERPALQKLLDDVRARKIKRLTDLPMLWSEQWGRIGLQAPAQVRAELR